ncbi:MAG: Uncharacterised protein [Marinobacterium sp. xm-d-530]|nr:MAG: Uncharacterised protein [Marinobacterium sp. xm-d-530]
MASDASFAAGASTAATASVASVKGAAAGSSDTDSTGALSNSSGIGLLRSALRSSLARRRRPRFLLRGGSSVSLLLLELNSSLPFSGRRSRPPRRRRRERPERCSSLDDALSLSPMVGKLFSVSTVMTSSASRRSRRSLRRLLLPRRRSLRLLLLRRRLLRLLSRSELFLSSRRVFFLSSSLAESDNPNRPLIAEIIRSASDCLATGLRLLC